MSQTNFRDLQDSDSGLKIWTEPTLVKVCLELTELWTNMDKTVFFSQRKAAAVVLVLLIVTQQVCASPVVSQDQSVDHEAQLQQSVRTLKRRARMSPLWRIMNSKPFGAYCQNNYECSTGLCRGGFCATMHRSATASVTN